MINLIMSGTRRLKSFVPISKKVIDENGVRVIEIKFMGSMKWRKIQLIDCGEDSFNVFIKQINEGFDKRERELLSQIAEFNADLKKLKEVIAETEEDGFIKRYRNHFRSRGIIPSPEDL